MTIMDNITQDEKTLEFLQKLKDKGHYNEDYDYSKVVYVKNSEKVIVIDKKFNTEHLIAPSSMLTSNSKCCGSNLINGYLSYDEAIIFVHSLKLKSIIEWKDYYKSGNKPYDIPSIPNRVYKDNGWVSWGEWLGTGRIATQLKEYLPYEEAKEIIHNLKLKSLKEWKEYYKSGDKPNDIPANPYTFYKDNGWVSWGDWLGSGIIANQLKEYLSYEEAIKIVHTLNLKSQEEWRDYCKSGNKPDDIPADPYTFYKDNGWVSMGEWLGSGIIANQLKEYLLYEEVKKIIHNLKLKSQKEWIDYCKSGNKPNNIPRNANQVYKDNGWVSWSHFLGYFGNGKHNWSNKLLIEFINSLKGELINLDSIELITIINSNNISQKLKTIGVLDKLVSSKSGSIEREELLIEIIEKIDTIDVEVTEDETLAELDDLIEGDINDIIERSETELSPLDPIKELKVYDNDLITASLDDENIDFLMKNQLKKLWNSVLNNKVDINQLKSEDGGENFNIIRNWFFEEYNEVCNIVSPADYIFKYKPNLMQKLITYRLIKEKRYGNWSGTGAGKTLSAIFAGRYAGAKNVVIVCNNATVEGWVNSIHEYFSNSNVYVKKELDSNNVNPNLYTIINKYDVNLDSNSNNYLILNYETFQQGDGDNIVKGLIDNNTIDYIILDEIQNVKQRDDANESTRRNVVNKLLVHSSDNNPDLMVMTMSATPIINNLTEPKKLIELLTGVSHDELNIGDSIINGIEMYKALTRYGLRYKPDYGINVVTEFIKIDGSHLADKITKLPKGAVAEFEKTLIQTKLDGIKHCIKPGTLIYTHYVTELSNVIGEYVKSMGLSIGYYTGDNKCGLNPFKRNEIDVLIGSSPIGTGVDGIQKVCNTLIPIVLPWTSSEYDQLVGRVNRQGSVFGDVKIYIPQVEIQLDNDSIWSWDKRRYNIIKYKATLADLAMDGIIPSSLLPPKTKLVSDAQEELIEWIKRIENNEIITISREELKIPLEPKLLDYKKQTLGDFSNMNQNWSVSKSSTVYDRLTTEPSEWYYYHSLYTEKRKQWSEIPYMEIANKIKRDDFIIGDFGCGENLLSKNIPNKVHSFDYVAIDNTVTACDISNVPLDDEVLDVVVLSLSLMGTNYVDYLKEAYRTLKHSCFMYISEPKNKWNGREEKLKQKLNDIGFTVVGDIKKTDKFLYIDAIKL